MSVVEAPTRIGELEVIRRIGAGGFGVVYLANDRRLGRRVALKLAHPGRGDLWREARAAARLAHPNVVTIYEIGDHDGSPYLVMEYVDGPTLRDRIEREPIPLAEALRIARDLAAAIAAAHREGIIHLDLTPSNVLLSPDGRARVVDFGLARIPGAARARLDDSVDPKKSTAAGTPTYMAPEQWRIEKLGPPADVWALGAITHMLVTGRPPVDGSAELVRERVAGAAALELATADLSNELTALLRSCLQKDPAARPPAADVAAALESSLAQVQQPTPFRGDIVRHEMIASLTAQVQRERVVTIQGAPGLGKSAIARGIATALRADGWKVAAVQLGEQPLLAIASALRASVSGAAMATRDDIDDRPTTIEEQVAQWSRSPERFAADLDDTAMAVGRFALVIDPLDPGSLEPAIAAALAAAIADDGSTHLVLVTRDEHISALAKQLGDLGSMIALVPPSRAELVAMLEQPIYAAGYRYEDGLVDLIAGDLVEKPSSISRLQTIGAALWERRDRETKTIPRSAYGALRTSPRSRRRWLVLAAGIIVVAGAAIAIAAGTRDSSPPHAVVAAGPQCAPYYFPKRTFAKAFNADGLQDAIVGVSSDGRSVLSWRRDCNVDRPWQLLVIDAIGDKPTTIDLASLPAFAAGSIEQEGWATLSGDALTVVVANREHTTFLASSRPARGSADFSPLAPGPFAAIAVTPPAYVMQPVISQDGLEFFYAVHDEASGLAKHDWLYHSVRSSTAVPFPAAAPMPQSFHGFAHANGISADRLTLFLEENYTVVLFTRETVNMPFKNPNAPTYPPAVAGFRTRPIGDCGTLIGTCTSGCNNEETCIFSR